MKEKVKDNVLEPKKILDQSFFKPKNGRNILHHFSQKILSITLFLYEYKKKGKRFEHFSKHILLDNIFQYFFDKTFWLHILWNKNDWNTFFLKHMIC